MGATSADATMRAQIEYWKTHTATTPQETEAKLAAYRYANDYGIKGAIFPNQGELALQGNKSSTNWDNLGTGLGVLGAGAAGLVTGGVGAAAVGGALAAAGPSVQAATANGTGTFGQGGDPAASYLTPVGQSGGGGAPQGIYNGLAAAAKTAAGQSDTRSTPTMPTQSPGQPAVAKGDPSNGPWDAFVPTGGIPATGGSMATPNYAPQTGTTGNPYLDALLAQTNGATTANQAVLNNTVLPAVKQQKDVNSQVGQNLGSNLTNEAGLIGGYGAFNGGLAAQGQQAASAANASNLGYLDSYQKTLGGMSQLTPTPYQGDYNSNPADVARQQSSYNALSGIGGGSLNYSAQQAAMQTAALAQAGYTGYTAQGYQAQQAQYELAAIAQAELERAQSNTEDVGQEHAALSRLSDIGGGSLDVKNGANDPAAWDAQHSALSQMAALTNPARTSQEEFLYEQQRQREVQDQATSRAAVMQNLKQRGFSGSGMELTDQAIEDQQSSQNRLLGDLGTQATAVARAQAALGNYGNLSTAMVGQGNQVAESNAANRLTGSTAQGQLAATIRGQGDQMSMFNADAFNQNSMFNTGQENAINVANMNAYNQANQFNANSVNDMNRFNANANNDANQFNANAYNTNQNLNAGLRESNAEFNANAFNSNQQFNAGAANDAAGRNQQTQLQGSIAAGSQAASMRTANDAVGMANQAQQGISNRANDMFRADQQVQATNRATDMFNSGQGTTQTNLGNTNQAINASSVLGDKTFGAGMQGVQDTSNYWNTLSGLGQQNTNNALAFGGLATNVNTAGASTASDALSKAAGNFAAQQANGSLGSNIYGTQTPYTPYVTYAPQYKQPGT